jgi:ribonuclease HII
MNKKSLLNKFQDNTIEVGIDEVGRGSLFGRVYVGGVILPNDLEDEYSIMIRDSKKLSSKKRKILRKYIEENAIDFYVGYEENTIIDQKNILQCTLDLMCKVIYNLNVEPELLLIDGNRFNGYRNKQGKIIPHQCIIGGDNKYMSIAAASILAKEYRDEYIEKMCIDNPYLNKYNIANNKGYGTKAHLEALKVYGSTKYHRTSYKPCKSECLF